ncbi:MAG: methyltransferase domain-containing protein [Planctomycetales bacterium]|nr:methyltransferase domain-containing protein [Planctomycetales bacterium]
MTSEQSNQEVQGLLSPYIRNQRLRQVASLIGENDVVLDLACGGGYLGKFLPEQTEYFGVDRIPFGSRGCAETKDAAHFLTVDLLDDDAPRQISEWLPKPPTCITMIAFLEHITEPAAFVETFSKLLASGGRIIGTTPHPVGRKLHDFLSKIRICSPDGADEHEEFLGKSALNQISASSELKMSDYKRFLFGLNQLFVYTADHEPVLA